MVTVVACVHQWSRWSLSHSSHLMEEKLRSITDILIIISLSLILSSDVAAREIYLLRRERNMHGAMVRAWRSADIAACRAVSNPALWRIFREISCFLPSQCWDIVKMLCRLARHLNLKCFTWPRWKGVPGRSEMAMCTISSMRRKGCRSVCSPCSWNGTRMNRSRYKVGW